MPVITDIIPQKKRKNRYSVFIDGIFFLGIGDEVLVKTRLKKGQSVDIDQLKELILQEEYIQARQYVFHLISRKLYTTGEIRTKLTDQGYEPAVMDKIIRYLTERNYLDDRKYAEYWLDKKRKSRPVGPAIIRQELSRKGIDRDLINEIIHSVNSSDQQIQWAQKALLKKKYYRTEPDSRKRNQKIYQYLAGKGFSPDIIREIIGQLRIKDFEDG